MKNIYSNYGNIIDTDRYIKREIEKEVENRIIDKDNYGSLSIVGLQRIGKSSIVYNMFLKNKEKYIEQKTIITFCKMSLYNNSEVFFKDIIQKTFEELEDRNFVNEIIERRYKRSVDSNLKTEGASSFLGFFKAIKANDIKVILIIDEFDHAKKIFLDFAEAFQVLRDLSYQPETKVAIILISRRLIEEIEIDTHGISTFSGILSQLYLKPYSKKELEEYFSVFFKTNEIEYNGKIIEEFENISGNMPLLLDVLSYNYINLKHEKSIQEIYKLNISEILDNLNKTINLLDEQNLLKKLMQFVFGPIYDATKEDFYKLENYGILSNHNGEIIIFSNTFLELLNYKQDSVDFYPLWNKTEKRLRDICKDVFEKKYENWEKSIVIKYKEISNGNDKKLNSYRFTIFGYINQAYEIINKMKKFDSYIKNTKATFIDGLTTGGLFELIYEEWDLFQDVFKENRESWSEKTKHITNARNPYQHNNDHLLTERFKNTTKLYLEFINEKINEFKKSN